MKNFNVKNIFLLLLFVSSLTLLCSCDKGNDDIVELPPAELLQGSWKCETTGGTWDILHFKSTYELDWQFIDANKQIITDEYTFVADGTNVFLTNKNNNSKSAHKYSINRDELSFQYFDGADYLYSKIEE